MLRFAEDALNIFKQRYGHIFPLNGVFSYWDNQKRPSSPGGSGCAARTSVAPASAAAFMVAVPPRFFYTKGVLEMIPEKSEIFQ